MRIAQLGAYKSNIGDSAALHLIREMFDESIEWVDINTNKKDWLNYDIINSCDLFVIGGGGLIQPKRGGADYSLPFTEKNMGNIKIPIIALGVGTNRFYGCAEFHAKAKESISHLINTSVYFGARDDGAYDILYEINNKTRKFPDAARHWNQVDISKNTKGYFNVVKDTDADIMKGRNINYVAIKSIIRDNELDIVCHCHKDLNVYPGFGAKPIVHENLLKCDYSLFNVYNIYKYGVCMRGHSQKVSLSKGIPSIYLSSNEKIRRFSEIHGLMEYTVDTKEPDYIDKLLDKVYLIKNNDDFRNKWFDIRKDIVANYNKDLIENLNLIEELLNMKLVSKNFYTVT